MISFKNQTPGKLTFAQFTPGLVLMIFSICDHGICNVKRYCKCDVKRCFGLSGLKSVDLVKAVNSWVLQHYYINEVRFQKRFNAFLIFHFIFVDQLLRFSIFVHNTGIILFPQQSDTSQSYQEIVVLCPLPFSLILESQTSIFLAKDFNFLFYHHRMRGM